MWGLISRRFACRARAPDAQLLNLNCNGSRIGSPFCGGSRSPCRVDDVHGRSVCDSQSPCSVAAHSHSLPLLNTNSAPLAITVRCRTCEFGNCVHLVGCQITRTSCFHVLTTSPGLPDSDGPKNEFVLCHSFIVHVCASFSRSSPIWNRRRLEESRRLLVKAQESARLDVPTATFILQCGPMSPTRVKVFVQMLGYVLVRQPTVILRE